MFVVVACCLLICFVVRCLLFVDVFSLFADFVFWSLLIVVVCFLFVVRYGLFCVVVRCLLFVV